MTERIEKLNSVFRGGSDELVPEWASVEEALESQLPGSFKRIYPTCGPDTWCNFLYLLTPDDFQTTGKEILDADRASRQEFPSHYPLALFPESGGLLPWAVTDNGDTLYFVTAGQPDDWPSMIRGPRAPEFEVSFLHPAQLVRHFVSGELKSTILAAP